MRAHPGDMNAILAIYPYKDEDLWVFDDARAGLDKEPFIAGADTMIDRALEAKGIVNGHKGFRLLFSGGQFPGYEFRFTWVREGEGGNWYHSADLNMEGWLCPALFKFFEAAPKEICAKFEPLSTQR